MLKPNLRASGPLHRSSGKRSRQLNLRVSAHGNTFGHSFRVTTFGESHGKGVGCVIDGVPPRLPITKQEIQVRSGAALSMHGVCERHTVNERLTASCDSSFLAWQAELDRRRPGQSRITTPRKESDTCEIYSGAFSSPVLEKAHSLVLGSCPTHCLAAGASLCHVITQFLAGVGDGITLGTPICIMVPNTDQKSQDYSEMAVAYRPSHADATYDMKYGIRAVSIFPLKRPGESGRAGHYKISDKVHLASQNFANLGRICDKHDAAGDRSNVMNIYWGIGGWRRQVISA